MQFMTSSFNKTMYKRNLMRFWMVPVFYFGLLFFMGPAMFMSSLGTNHYAQMPDETRHLYGMYMMGYHLRNVINPVFIMMIAVTAMIAVFSYLYNTRATLTTHAFPVSRRGLYITGLASAFTMILVPQLLIGVITAIIALVNGVFVASALGTYFLFSICYDVIFVGIASCILMLSGQAVTAVGFYFLANYLSILMKFMFDSLSTFLYIGISEATMGWGIGAPAYYLGLKSGFDLRVEYAEDLKGYLTSINIGARGVGLTLCYTLIAIGLLFLGYFAYVKRPVETVNDFISFGWLKPIFVVGGSFFIGMAGAFLIDSFFQGSPNISSEGNRIIVLTAMVLCALVLFFMAHMLVEKSFRVFTQRNIKLCCLYAVCLVCFAIFMKVDLFGVQRYVPKLSDIENIKFNVEGESYTVDDEAGMKELLGMHSNIVELLDEVDEFEREYGRSLAFTVENDMVYEEPQYIHYIYLRFFYTMKNGSYAKRSYSIAFDKDAAVSPQYKALMDEIYRFANSYDNANKYGYGGKLEQKGPTYINIYKNNEGIDGIVLDISTDNIFMQRNSANIYGFDSNEFMDELYMAFLTDWKEGKVDIIPMDDLYSEPTVNFCINFEIKSNYDDDGFEKYAYDYNSLRVIPTLESEHILSVLDKYNVITH